MQANVLPNDKSCCYTAAQLAAALCVSKRRVLKWLESAEPTEIAIVRGNEADAWSIAALPDRLKGRLLVKARAANQTPEVLILTASQPWAPRIALAELSRDSIEAAQRLRDALLPALRMSGGNFGDQIARGRTEYERAFGHPISERHMRRILNRTMQRDGGRGEFERIELYVSDQPARRPAEKAAAPDFPDLAQTVASFRDPAKPTHKELAALWSEAFEIFEADSAVKNERKARAAMIEFLWRAVPAIGKTENAVRVKFARKYEKWKTQDGQASSLIDGRKAKRGAKIAPEFPQTDIDLITWEAATRHRGRIAPAVRDLKERGELSSLTLGRLGDSSSDKSYVNRSLVAVIRPEVKAATPFILGKKAIDDATPSIERDYSSLASMKIVTADDFTLNNYFYVPDGKGWFTLTRGQTLLMIDCRSLKIIGWSLQPERNYNAMVIRTLQNRVCRKWGLPSRWYFERGIWKNARLVQNAAPTHWRNAASWPEAAVGWGEIGVKFMHATRARSKPAELVGGLLQNILDGLPGYCGRNEREDCPEITRKAMDGVRAGREHPSKHFLNFEQWEAELASAIEKYNRTVQQGRILAGFSPDEAFEKFWPHDDPPTKFDATCWHLLAHYVSEREVKTDGICFSLGANSYRYFNERTSRDRGRMVMAWFDPELPDLLGVTDLNGRNPYLAERAGAAPFAAAQDDPVYRAELKRAAAHNSYPKARYHVLAAKFKPSFRANMVDRKTAEVATEFSARREEMLADKQDRQTTARTVHRKAERLGIPGALLRGTSEEAALLEEIAAARRENAANEKG